MALTPEKLLNNLLMSHLKVLQVYCDGLSIERVVNGSIQDALQTALSSNLDWDSWLSLQQDTSYGLYLTSNPLKTNDKELQRTFRELNRMSEIAHQFIEKLKPYEGVFLN